MCYVYPSLFYVKDNMFLIHYCFYKQKIAINYYIEEFLTYGKQDPNEMQKLSAKMLKYQGWEILDITEREFREWDDKVGTIKGWLKEAKAR